MRSPDFILVFLRKTTGGLFPKRLGKGQSCDLDSSGTSGTPEKIMNKNGPMVIHNGKFDHGISMVNNIVNNG